MSVQMKRERKRNPTTYDFYSNQRNLIFTNLTFLFIGHWEQTMNFHCLKKIEWVAALLPSVIRSSNCFEMVARIIMWLYKTSNIDQVRTSFKFFLNELPPIEAWQFSDIRGCPVSREEISWPWSFSTKPLQFVGLLTAKLNRKSSIPLVSLKTVVSFLFVSTRSKRYSKQS